MYMQWLLEINSAHLVSNYWRSFNKNRYIIVYNLKCFSIICEYNAYIIMNILDNGTDKDEFENS